MMHKFTARVIISCVQVLVLNNFNLKIQVLIKARKKAQEANVSCKKN